MKIGNGTKGFYSESEIAEIVKNVLIKLMEDTIFSLTEGFVENNPSVVEIETGIYCYDDFEDKIIEDSISKYIRSELEM